MQSTKTSVVYHGNGSDEGVQKRSFGEVSA
jgi:hypothetical protein